MDRGAWWAIIHGVAKSQTWLKWLSSQSEQICQDPHDKEGLCWLLFCWPKDLSWNVLFLKNWLFPKVIFINIKQYIILKIWGVSIPHASWPKNQNIKQKQYCNKFQWRFFKWYTSKILKKKNVGGTSLVVQGLRLHSPSAGDLSWIPGQETRCHNYKFTCLSCSAKDPL